MPRAQELAWRSIREGLSRYARPDAAVGIVCFTTDRQPANLVGREFTERLDTIGIDTHLLLWADETRWADLATGDMGPQTDAARERVATMSVLAGRPQPAATRDSLAQSLVGDREPVAALLTKTRANIAASSTRIESRWAVSRVQQFHRDGVRLDDADTARLLVAVEAIPIRDQLWLGMTRGNAVAHVAMWTDMTKRAPDEVRAAPASLLAFGSWLSGDGAMAWCALDQVPHGKPYALANLVAAAIERGIHPREWAAVSDAPKSGAAPVSELLPSHTAPLGFIRPHLASDVRKSSRTRTYQNCRSGLLLKPSPAFFNHHRAGSTSHSCQWLEVTGPTP